MEPSPPIQFVRDLINSHTLARCLHVVAALGVPDALEDQPTTAAELARRTGSNADALNRILRLLAAHDVFAAAADGYVHTAASKLLRGDHPQSLRSFARMLGMPVVWNGFTELEKAARTGRPALEWAAFIQYLESHPEEASLFNEAMVGKSGAIIPAAIAAYDFSRFGTIADIGGGQGHLLRAILERSPSTSGVLFDLPHMIADAARAAPERIRLVAGDFFVDALPVADAYVLMEVLHDWTDDRAQQILAAVRRAAPSHARVLIIETLMAEAPGPQFGKTLDVMMLAITGGRERTAAEYGALLHAADFHLDRVVPIGSQHSLIEATIARRD
jgi:O-methyltransferase domain